MKRYSTVLLLACWLVLLYVVSSITFAALDSDESDSPAYSSSQTLNLSE